MTVSSQRLGNYIFVKIPQICTKLIVQQFFIYNVFGKIAIFEHKRYEKPRDEARHFDRPQGVEKSQTNYPKANPSDFVPVDAEEIQAGMRVLHQKFGQGTVVRVEGVGPNKKASVDFDESGNKMLMLKFAKLSILK